MDVSIRRSSKLGTFFSLLFLGAVITAIWQRQALIDWWLLRDYTPPAAISQLAEATTMNDKGKHLFYVYHPRLEGKDTFRNDCASFEQSIVLGCYKSLEAIYIFDVEDERLAGVEEVTAAHEMLHVAYERLSKAEKKRISNLLQAEEAKLTDERIKETLSSYRKNPSTDLPNEMHSIFGTELEILSPELEMYYSQYFSDRSRIVSLSKKYEAEFVSREQKIEEIDAKLTETKSTFEALKTQIDAEGDRLESERSEMQRLRNENPEVFNERLAGYNSAVRSYNRLIDEARSLVDEYNSLIEQRNALASERRELLNALDSRASAL